MRKSSPRLLLTCEHAGNRIPREYAHLFRDSKALLASHRGWDPGALEVTRHLSRSLGVPFHHVMWSRLLVESNRSPSNPRIWSSITTGLPFEERARILEAYWWPHRRAILDELGRIRTRPVLHVAIHSFTPELNGVVRKADVGLLYDPERTAEREWCRAWRRQMRVRFPGLRVRMNYPYEGRADGLTTWLRRQFPEGRYAGVELEFNQVLIGSPGWRMLKRALVDSLSMVPVR